MDEIVHDGLIHITSIVTQGSFNPEDHIWQVTNLDPYACASMQITYRLSPLFLDKDFQTCALIHDESITEISPYDNISCQRVMVEQYSDFGVMIVVDNQDPIAGSTVLFTIAVINKDPYSIHPINTMLTIPNGFVVLNEIVSAGHYDAFTKIWTIENLAPRQVATFSLAAQVPLVITKHTVEIVATILSTHRDEPNILQDSVLVTIHPNTVSKAVIQWFMHTPTIIDNIPVS